MAGTLTDTTGWQVVVPIKPALDLTGSRLTATLADRFGGAVVALDSAVLVPGYDGAHQIDWTADANGLTDAIVLTVTRAMRGAWFATGPNGLPGLATLFADVKRTVAGSARDPEPLGRTSVSVLPGTDSPAVAAASGAFQAVLTPGQGLQAVTATVLQVGPQGPQNTAYVDAQVAAATSAAATDAASKAGAAKAAAIAAAATDAASKAGAAQAAAIAASAADAGAKASAAQGAAIATAAMDATAKADAAQSAAIAAASLDATTKAGAALTAAAADAATKASSAQAGAIAAAADDASTKASAAQAAAIAAAATDAGAKASAAQAAAISAAAADAASKADAAQAAAIAAAATDATTKANARAASGANSDIKSLLGLTTALSASQGGTGATSLQAIGLALTAAQIANVTIPVTSFRTTGYAVEGDGGDAIYVRGTSASVGAVKDAAGTWWSVWTGQKLAARALGCRFDGGTDDYAALNAVITAVIKGGLWLEFPVGTALTKGKLGFNGNSIPGAQFFRISGAGRGLSRIKRGSAWNNNAVLEFDNFPNGFELDGFAVNANNSGFATPGISALVVYNSSNVRLRGLLYTDFTNSGLLAYGDVGAGMTNVVSERCHASGVGGFGAVGQMYANCTYSGFEDCTAEGIIASPAYGLELKNACAQSWIRGGWVRNSGTAVAFGQDIQATAVTDSWVYGTASINNQNAFVSGYAQRCSVTLPYVDMNDNYANGDAVHMAFSKGMHVQIGVIKNVKRNAAYFDASTTDCVVEIGEIDNDLGTGTVAYFDTGSDRNTVRLKRFSNPSSITAALFTNVGGAGNTFVYDPTATSTGTIYPAGATNISAQTPDNTATGGNSRGLGAVDFQVGRDDARQVAGGAWSFIGGGYGNRTSASYSGVFGTQNFASGLGAWCFGINLIADANYAQAYGYYATTRATAGKVAFACGRFGALGDAQLGEHLLRAATTGTTAARATSDGAAAAAGNSIPIPVKSAFAGRVTAVAIDTATYDAAMWTIDNLLASRGASGAPILVGAPTVTKAQASAGASAWTLALAVDATNNGLSFTVTGSAGSAIHLVLHHYGPEVQ